MDKEDKKKYQKKADASRICIRMNAKERALVEAQMHKENWANMSTYIRFKLLGINTDKKIDDLIENNDAWEIGNLLRNQVFELAEHYMYIRFRYNKDMTQLYREEGADVKEWAKRTNHYYESLTKKTEELFGLLARFARKLKLDNYFERPSDSMHIDFEEHDTEKLDAIAEQLRLERIAYGGNQKI